MTLGNLLIGSIVTDKKTKFNGKPIEWLVADHNYGCTTLLSKDILCCRPFDNPKEYYKNVGRREFGSNRWRDSDIRKWLETEFYRKSFSSRLAGLTIPVLNATEIPTCDRAYRNEYMVDNTEDIVFLLSDAEVGSEGDSEAIALFRSNNKGKYRIAEVCPELTWYWWLRSPNAGSSYGARTVDTDGSLGHSGAYIGDYGVRPACAISSSAPVKIRKSGEYKFDWKEVADKPAVERKDNDDVRD